MQGAFDFKLLAWLTWAATAKRVCKAGPTWAGLKLPSTSQFIHVHLFLPGHHVCFKAGPTLAGPVLPLTGQFD